jgi:uncharacterized protein YjbI with pentapeptide repeats
VDWSFADLTGAKLMSSVFRGSKMGYANLSRSDLRGATFDVTAPSLNLAGATGTADFSGATIRDVDMRDANLAGSNFSHATLFGAYAPNANLANVNMTGALVFGSILLSANLGGDWSGANLSGVRAAGASIQSVNFAGANITSADFSGAQINIVNFTNASLTAANFSGATFLNPSGVTYSNTTCPDSSNSDSNGGTCAGHGGGL